MVVDFILTAPHLQLSIVLSAATPPVIKVVGFISIIPHQE
jgi:hypothetical protein